MKRKTVERIKPKSTKKKGWNITTQTAGNILILNFHNNGILQNRYCMNCDTGEHEVYNVLYGKWTQEKIFGAADLDTWCYSTHNLTQRAKFASKEDEKRAETMVKPDDCQLFRKIDNMESEHDREKRLRKEGNRARRLRELMLKVPDVPEDFSDWIYRMAAGGNDYAFYIKNEDKYQCTGCGKKYSGRYLRRTDGEKKIRHNDMCTCPRCRKTIQVIKRTNKKEIITHATLLQDIDETMSVARYFDVDIFWSSKGRTVTLDEAVRILLYKDDDKYTCRLYYAQYYRGYGGDRINRNTDFGTSNPYQRREYTGYLYPGNIREALEGTFYSTWTDMFETFARDGAFLHYNRLMAAAGSPEIISTIELLYKGRFRRLTREVSESIDYYSGRVFSPLYIDPELPEIEEVFRIADRQKINRIRELDGGFNIVYWMQWSDENGQKITQECLEWLLRNNITQEHIRFIRNRMSLQQIMNYVIRQQSESYKKSSATAVLSQWADYLSMAKNEGKDTEDEMVYRPRELKRRHDEIVEAINKRQMLEQMKRDKKQAREEAKRYRERFPAAEGILAGIKEKLEYRNEEYIITVPKTLMEIVLEGQALHHCAGATDRYFDRICQNETYICFLRRAEEPEIPYYTIEVEPGGTIRQHRGYLDEEPNIQQIKPFLREWQKEVRKKMSRKDHELAAVSKEKREANLEELRAKNNTRVLQGLMQDFMEAI